MLNYRSVLLVDDDADDRFLFQEAINEIDASLIYMEKQDGVEALKYLKETEQLPDIIFLDLNMPRMNGKECLVSLKNDTRLASIPTIIYSTFKSPKSVNEVVQLGADFYLQKPVNYHDLYNSIKFILNGEYKSMISF